MKVLVTGGLGYVGGRLSVALKQKCNSKDVMITTCRTSYPPWTKNFNVLNMNLLDHDSIYKTIESVKPDAVIHLAAVQQAKCKEDRRLARDVNVNGTKILLDACESFGVKRDQSGTKGTGPVPLFRPQEGVR